ncbi:hypothetical protein NliqN6_3407 [Naganishia liquefaciens]|uniref:Tetratricopeptide repeat protein n=1 Tax=Naganishia liquefaciens TaxID=104408 RepID=A0A8H3TTL5_9TREE|nr:hypothetical protein NliqN6_3407 [Naganishia liquefaciens]
MTAPEPSPDGPGFLAPPTAPSSSAHGLGLGPTLVVLDDPSNKYLQAQQSFYATHPPSHTTVTSSIPNVAPPLPVSLPRLPCIPPLVVHQEQLYFDDGLGAPGRCPHDRKWGQIGHEHREERGLGLTDVEMDDFMVDLGDLISKEYDAWIERCWVEAFHYTYTVSIPALIIGFILSGSTPTFLRRSIIYGGPHMDSLLAQQFRLLLRQEHEKRMSDEQGSRRGVDIGNLLAGLVPGTMSSGSGGGAAVGDGRASSRIAAGGGLEGSGIIDGTATPPFSGTNGSYYAQQASYSPYPAPLDGSQTAPPAAAAAAAAAVPNPAYRPPSAASATSSSIQHPHQRHLWDPARTGYGNGICFYDLALLHGRNGDDHGPCMCDLTACRTCFHELLYFRGRRDVVPPPVPPSMAMMDGLHAPPHPPPTHGGMGMTTTTMMPPPPPSVHVPHDDVDTVEASLTQAGAGPEPPEYVREDGADGMEDGEYEVEVNGRPDGMYDSIPTPQGSENAHHLGYQQQQQQHYTQTSTASSNFPHVQYTSQPSAAPKRPSPLQIRHPEMSDILLVEEHLRTRLHYMASPDVILRYGDEDEFIPPEEPVMPPSPPIQDASLASTEPPPPPPSQPKQQVKVIQGRKMKGGKMKGGQQKLTVAKTVPSPTPSPSTSTPERSLQERERERAQQQQQQEVRTRLNGSQLPRSWTDESASSRNMAVILTFRHLVKLLHATASYLSPFDFDDYADDSAVLTEIHPLAVYRRLVEPYVRRRAAAYEEAKLNGLVPDDDNADNEVLGGDINKVDVKAWKRCMEQWEKEVAVREKEGGNAILKTQPARAVAFYTQAICLDSENPVYYLNRAAAFNAIENYEDAEIDCSRALSLNRSHLKAFYRRAVARKGMGRLDEAEEDLLHLLNQAPNIAAATAELASIRKEIEEMKKREEVDDID